MDFPDGGEDYGVPPGMQIDHGAPPGAGMQQQQQQQHYQQPQQQPHSEPEEDYDEDARYLENVQYEDITDGPQQEQEPEQYAGGDDLDGLPEGLHSVQHEHQPEPEPQPQQYALPEPELDRPSDEFAFSGPPPSSAMAGNQGDSGVVDSMNNNNNLADSYPEDYVEAFQIYDKEYGDEGVSAKMLGTVLRALGQNPTEGQLREITQNVMAKDVYSIADVDFILKNHDLRDQCSSSEIQEMWDMVCASGGAAGAGATFVQKSALQKALSSIGDKIMAQDFNMIMMAANVTGDVVTFEQFQRIMTN